MKGRDGRKWRQLVATARRELPPICHLCGDMIDMGLPWNDRMSWTLDHVSPLAVGGVPEDLANLRPAHRRCNSIKGKDPNKVIEKPKGSRIW